MYRKFIFVIGIAVFVIASAIAGCNSKTVDQLCTEGIQQIQAGNPNGAIVLLKNALEKDPNHSEARYQLAKAYAAVGKYEQAEREFFKLFKQNPGREEIKLDLAKVYCSLNKPESAIAEANEFLIKHPGSADALEILGIASYLSKKPLEAESYLLQALKSDPVKSSAKLELAHIYAGQKKTVEAQKLLHEVISADPKNAKAYYLLASIEALAGNRAKTIEIYGKLARLNPTDPTPFYKTGLINIENGEIDKATKSSEEIISRFPKHADGYRLRGICSLYRKKYADAVTDIQQSIKMQPTVEGYYFLGLSLYNIGELENALSQFRIIIDHNPSFVQARLMTALILLTQKRIDDSISEINNILKIDANNALAHNLLGSAYMANGMTDEGLQEFNRALELDPKLVEAHLKKGMFYLSRGNLNEAETDLRTAVTVRPELLNSRLILFSYYMHRNEHAKAIAVIEGGIKGNKNDAVLYNCIAAVKFSENKPAEAVKFLQKAKNTNPEFFAPYFNMAIFHASSGAYDKALAEYGEVLRKDPKNTKAMLSSAAILELTGKESEALNWYNRAKATNDPAAFIMLAEYLARKKQAGKAISVLEEAIKANPRNADILDLKGRFYLSEKNYREAIKVFDDLESIAPDRGIPLKINTYVAMKDIPKAVDQARRVITLKPNSSYGYIILASIYESQNDLDRAVAELKNGINREKDSLQAMLKLGGVYIRKRDYGQASNILEEAVRKNPNSAPALFAQGSLLEITGKKDGAILKYRQALSKSENFVPALNNLAYLYTEGYGNKKEALRLATSAFRQEPGNAGVMDTLGYALIKNGRSTDALKVLEKAGTILADNPTVNYHLALAYLDTGNKGKAAASLRKALKIGNFPEENDANKLLAQLK